MKKPLDPKPTPSEVPANIWITRLSETLKIVAAMEPDERAAAFAFLKSKFRDQWPGSDF